MDINSLVTQLMQESARINQAIAALEALNATGLRRGRLSKVSQSTQTSRPRRRTLSAAARAKIAAAQRARWAKQRAAATPRKAARGKTDGPATWAPARARGFRPLLRHVGLGGGRLGIEEQHKYKQASLTNLISGCAIS